MKLDNLIDQVISAKGNKNKLQIILQPILDDATRLQHLDEMRNDILPWDGDLGAHPMVNAEWLLRTPNGFKDVGLRTYIDDDIEYWKKQKTSHNQK